MTNEVAERYAQGLFELAKENGTVDEKKEQAEALRKVLDENPDFLLFLQAVKITRSEKKKLIREVFSQYLDSEMVSFIQLLVDKDRSWYLSEMLDEYIKRANEELGVETAVVASARPLAEEDLEKIRKALEKKTGKKIILRNKIDPSVLAGIKVIVGNNVTDITMKTRIENMRKALLEGGMA
ncbi:MAG: F0F1 ATP synthase subunit delta [Solobacterium sp.]|nr:F0F1 ATP synthase subunit delta [Solobacterium sp.]